MLRKLASKAIWLRTRIDNLFLGDVTPCLACRDLPYRRLANIKRVRNAYVRFAACKSSTDFLDVGLAELSEPVPIAASESLWVLASPVDVAPWDALRMCARSVSVASWNALGMRSRTVSEPTSESLWMRSRTVRVAFGVSSLRVPICHVCSIVSKEQMGNAGPNVAVMKHVHSRRDRAVAEFPRYAMSTDFRAVQPE